MRSFVIAAGLCALAALPPAGLARAAEPTPAASAAPPCPVVPPLATRGGPESLRRLGELPPGRVELAVIRSIGGCWVASVKVGDQVHYEPATGVAPTRLTPADHVPRQR